MGGGGQRNPIPAYSVHRNALAHAAHVSLAVSRTTGRTCFVWSSTGRTCARAEQLSIVCNRTESWSSSASPAENAKTKKNTENKNKKQKNKRKKRNQKQKNVSACTEQSGKVSVAHKKQESELQSTNASVAPFY